MKRLFNSKRKETKTNVKQPEYQKKTLVDVRVIDFLKTLTENDSLHLKKEELALLKSFTENACISVVKVEKSGRHEYTYFNILGTEHFIVRHYIEAFRACHPNDWEDASCSYSFKKDFLANEKSPATFKDFATTYNLPIEIVAILKKSIPVCRAFFGMKEDLKYLHRNNIETAKELGLNPFVNFYNFATSIGENGLTYDIMATFRKWSENEIYVKEMYCFTSADASRAKSELEKILENCSLEELQTLAQFLLNCTTDTSASCIDTERHAEARESAIALNREAIKNQTTDYVARFCEISKDFAATLGSKEVVPTFEKLLKFAKAFLQKDTEQVSSFRGILTGLNTGKTKVMKHIVDCFKQEFKEEASIDAIALSLENENFCNEFASKIF